MMKSLPEGMFTDPEQSRFSMLRSWILENAVTEISMNERAVLDLGSSAAERRKALDDIYGTPHQGPRHAG